MAEREGGAPNGAPPPDQQPSGGPGWPGGGQSPRFRPVGEPFQVPTRGAPIPGQAPPVGPGQLPVAAPGQSPPVGPGQPPPGASVPSRAAPAPTPGVPPRALSSARTIYRVPGTPADQTGRGWATRWALPVLRVALSLPLVQFAAVSAGLALYSLYLAGSHPPDEPSGLSLWLVAFAAAVVCGVSLLGFATALRECPRHRLWLWSFVASVVAALAAAAGLALGVDAVPAAIAAAALFYTAVVAAVCGVIGICDMDTGRPADRATGLPRTAWLWRSVVAGIAFLLAAAAAGLALSLFADSYVPAQAEFHLGSSIWQQVSHRGGLGLFGGLLALIAANAGLAALFGLLVHVGMRALGWWRGRLHAWWLGVAGVTVALGVIAWILDSSLPRW